MNNSVVDQGSDPAVLDWASMELPNTWADQLNFSRPADLFHFFKSIFGAIRSRVEIPEDMPGFDRIPKYVLQEFHRVPNGNYSKRITRGYITGFEHSMLGLMQNARQTMANHLKGCQSVLDAGCAGGKTADALQRSGIPDVWGLDPSPYLLQHASTDFPSIKFVQGVVEDTGFAAERFDGVTACFLFHEMPPRYLERAFMELNRILKPGGLLVFCEPSDLQISLSFWQLLKRYGLRGMYFGSMARFVYEPFLGHWHQAAHEAFFAEYGFKCEKNEVGVPFRQTV